MDEQEHLISQLVAHFENVATTCLSSNTIAPTTSRNAYYDSLMVATTIDIWEFRSHLSLDDADKEQHRFAVASMVTTAMLIARPRLDEIFDSFFAGSAKVGQQ